MNEAREGVAIFGPGGECRFASEGFTGWVGQPLALDAAPTTPEALWQAFARAGVQGLAGVRGGFLGPLGAFLASVEKVDELAVVRTVPLEQGDGGNLHGRFLSVASHDLRGALANVRSYASLLKSPRFGLEEKALRALEVIARNTDRALALAEDIFDTLKSDNGSLRVERSPEPLRPLLERALERCAAAAKEKGLQVHLEADAAAPLASVDPDRFTRACENLLAHAIWRSLEDGQVGLSVTEEAGQLCVSAWDEALPATAEALSLAFERDLRVAQERTLSGGFRLGLARALVRALDGDVGARIDPHGRQNFFFTLPVHASEQPSAPS